jgi:anti-sigma B factor antagonist
MEYPTRNEKGYTILELNGEVDLHYSPQARKQILKILDEGEDLLVDLRDVKYIDSSGVASLVEGYQLAKNDQRKFALIGVSDAAMQVLQLARLDQVFPIFDDVEHVQ